MASLSRRASRALSFTVGLGGLGVLGLGLGALFGTAPIYSSAVRTGALTLFGARLADLLRVNNPPIRLTALLTLLVTLAATLLAR